jgi:hypothetical protein
MKTFTFVILNLIFLSTVFSQNIKHIAMFEGETYNNTGKYGATDSVVYRYSNMYGEWFPLETTGLPIINESVNIIDLAVADTGTSYTSGIYIIADTAVFNYNWNTAEWYPLSNEGLIRIGGVVQLSKISVFGKGSSTDQSIFCISDTSVFEYEWYYPKWFALDNTGLTVNVSNTPSLNKEIKAYPNPFNKRTNLELKLETPFTGTADIAVYDTYGKLVLAEKLEVFGSNKIEYSLDKRFESGIYFCEIKAGTRKAIISIVAE